MVLPRVVHRDCIEEEFCHLPTPGGPVSSTAVNFDGSLDAIVAVLFRLFVAGVVCHVCQFVRK